MRLYYDDDGNICDRPPYFPEINENREYIEVSEEVYSQTLSTPALKKWIVLDEKPVLIDLEINKFTANMYISMYKSNLKDTDYQAIKYSEGQISEQDYAPIKAQRQAWRDEINRLEELLKE